eukprot:jgi/Astpho2/9456/Aster-01714
MAMHGGVKFVLACVAVLLLTAVLTEMLRPQLLLVGNLTVDLVEGKKALGGSIAYAAAVATAYGVRACIVTAGGSDADLSAFQGHELHVVSTEQTLTFDHTYTWWGNNRKLRVMARPNVTLTMEHVPPHCRRARTALLGPLTPADLDAASFVDHKQGWWDRLLNFQQQVGYMAQGEQRALDKGGKVSALKEPNPQLVAALGPRTSVFLSDVETSTWSTETVPQLASKSARWLVTRGEFGADEVTAAGMQHLEAEKVTAVDTNGAGDTFATSYMLALAARRRSPGSDASWAASKAVMLPQVCKPHCVTDRIKEELLLASAFAGALAAPSSDPVGSIRGLINMASAAALIVAAWWYLSTAQPSRSERQQECPKCGGTGFVECFCSRWSDNDAGCGSCRGTGRMVCNACGGGGTAVPIKATLPAQTRNDITGRLE